MSAPGPIAAVQQARLGRHQSQKREPIVPVVHRDGREAAVSPDVAFTNTKLLQLLACLKSRSGPFITNC